MKEIFIINPKKVIKLSFYVLAAVLGIFIIYKLSTYLAPFVIAFIISLLMEPIIRFLTRKLKLNRKIAALISLLLLLLIIGFVLALIILRLISEIESIVFNIPNYINDLITNLNLLFNKAVEIYEWLPDDITKDIGAILSNLSASVINLSKSIAGGAITTAISIPHAIIFIFATIMATYFFASDREKIYGFVKEQLPGSWIAKLSSIKSSAFSAMFGYLKAMLIIMCITFTEIFIGLTIIRVRYSALLALIISFIDILPILGTGTVLIPWGIYSILIGRTRLGVSLLILYVIVLIIRQIIEPKIVGGQIGIHPLITLIAIYVGLRTLGVFGMILGPITFLLLKNIIASILKGRTFKELIQKD
ncbi:MAG TPA: sporulation integral membrane protein YtvI [Clostridiaceae bacterium]|nr:sporulation integral membrane protein YtvI [Clostridiaceae bacterium]